jgi:hypothetical protein
VRVMIVTEDGPRRRASRRKLPFRRGADVERRYVAGNEGWRERGTTRANREERKDDTRRLGTSGWKNDMIEQGGTQSG